MDCVIIPESHDLGLLRTSPAEAVEVRHVAPPQLALKRTRTCCPPLMEPLEERYVSSLKKSKVDEPPTSSLDSLPDELLLLVLGFAAEGCDSPNNFFNMLLTSKRVYRLGFQAQVLCRLQSKAIQVAPVGWCSPYMRFLSLCCRTGNVVASYALGMIGLYCLDRPDWALGLLADAAVAKNAEALYALAIVHFNGSGGTKEHRDVAAGVLLCMQAAELGHVDAMRELGHCLQDGYGVKRDPFNGRQLLLRADVEETQLALNLAALQPRCRMPCCATHLSRCAVKCRTGKTNHTHFAASHRAISRSLSAPPDFPEFPVASGDLRHTTDQDYSAEFAENGGMCCDAKDEAHPRHTRNPPSTAGPDELRSASVSGAAPFSVETEASTSGSDPQGTGHQCFCLPSVLLPLDARPDGWVRRFLLDWYAMGMDQLMEQSTVYERCAGADLEEVEDGPTTEAILSPSSRGCLPCSNPMCGRRELRVNEFRCCSACTEARYCSRVCQAMDWKTGHKTICSRRAQNPQPQAQ